MRCPYCGSGGGNIIVISYDDDGNEIYKCFECGATFKY
jgi:DNA-directed RNA polymerase subunit RPC12/RpoP